ncbi:MAG: hypothetical protein N2486_04140 [Caloramator sp.]|nr:hypothetical protein [Caloramator sp.]
MNKAFSTIKFYVNSVFGFSGLFRDLKYDKKKAVKTLGLIILILFSFSGLITMFTAFNIKMYDLLKPINQQGLVVLNTVIISTAFTFFLGILTVIATYFLNQEGDIILSLPLKPWNLFIAKFAISYLSEALFAFVIMATGIIVYGVKNGEGVLYYINSLLITLTIPIIPLVIGYFLITPTMKFGKLLKKKDFIMYISGFLAIGIGVIFQYLTNQMANFDKNPEFIMQKLTAPNGLIDSTSKLYYPAVIAAKAIINNGKLESFIYLIIFIAIALCALILLLFTMSNIYYDTLIGSTEVQKSTKRMDEKQLKKTTKKRNLLITLVDRELKLMNREPVYFINGPMVIFLLPIIMGASIYFQKNTFLFDIKKVMNHPDFSYYLNLISIGVIIFLGASTSIAATCISREGRAFEIIKSLPINPKLYITAKIIHGLVFGILAAAIILIMDLALFKIGIISLLIILITSIILLTMIFIIEIFAELKWPKLNWDNPQKAIKQNINGVVGILGTMGFVAIFGAIIVRLNLKSNWLYIALILIPLIISSILYQKLLSYVDKRFYEIEI